VDRVEAQHLYDDQRQAMGREEIWLLGQPSLAKFLSYVEDSAINGEDADVTVLANEWRAANDHYIRLEKLEAGIADAVEVLELEDSYTAMAERVAADRRYSRTFDPIPTRFGMVELARLLVCQLHVTGNYVDAHKVRLGPNPDRASLFQFCLPSGDSDPSVEVRRVGARRYAFRSDSRDFRFHEPVLLRPDQLSGYQTFGQVTNVVGLVVGFSSNFLNVIRYGKRLLLHNGYHRACALLSLGVTHVPCVIQTVTRPDELQLIAKSNVVENPDFFFEAPRPPLLKDYLDPMIRKVIPIHKLQRVIEVSYEVRDYLVPE
jgi:hypothetical protein